MDEMFRKPVVPMKQDRRISQCHSDVRSLIVVTVSLKVLALLWERLGGDACLFRSSTPYATHVAMERMRAQSYSRMPDARPSGIRK